MTEIFVLLASLPDVPKPLNNLPGCYERDLPDGWHVSINAHDIEMTGGSENHGVVVPPFAAVFTNSETMALAMVTPQGGTCAGGIGIEDSIIEALNKAGATLPTETA